MPCKAKEKSDVFLTIIIFVVIFLLRDEGVFW